MRAVTGSWLCVPGGRFRNFYPGGVRPGSPVKRAARPLTVGDVPVANVLKQLGAKLERGTTSRTLEDHSRLFDRTDTNRDGKHTTKEYVENGRYLTPQARSGIFRAADGNGDGVVTRAEYILNRIDHR